MVPPMSLTSEPVMARPSPVPSMLAFRSSSTRVNTLKSFSLSSSLIPIPVSLTSILKSIPSSVMFSPVTLRPTRPFLVYLTAFVRTLVIICCMRTSSPFNTEGMFSSNTTTNLSPFSTARLSTRLRQAVTTSFM